jgi:hypothetical protein
MRRAVLMMTVSNFGKGYGKVTCRLGKNTYSFDWDSSVCQTNNEMDHIREIARLVQNTVQQNLPAGNIAEVDLEELVLPMEYDFPIKTYAFLFMIHKGKK